MHEKTIKSRLILYALGGFMAFFTFYVGAQFIFFSKVYEEAFLKEAYQIKSTFEHIIGNYRVILENIYVEIKEKNLFSKSEEIAQLLSKIYVQGVENNDRNGRLRAIGITWIGLSDFLPINRLGALKIKPSLSLEYLKKLEQNAGKFQTAKFLSPEISSHPRIINFGIGVEDSKRNYKGFINARINIGSLIEKLNYSHEEHDLQLILLDETSQVIASSIRLSSQEEQSLSSLKMKITQQEKFQKYFSNQFYIFPLILNIQGVPCFLLIGYNKKQFYTFFIKQIISHASLLLLFSFLLIIFFYYYHKRLIRRLENFCKEKHKNNKILTGKTKNLAEYIRCMEDAAIEGKKFQLAVNRRIACSFAELMNVGGFLLKRVPEDKNMEEKSKELVSIFEKAYIHSRFFCVKNEENLIDVYKILDEVFLITNKMVLKKNIHLVKHIKKNIKKTISDGLCVKQVLLNIILRAIHNSPMEGNMELRLFMYDNNICLECKDNGYREESPSEQQSTQTEQNDSVDCMFIEWKNLEIVVKSLGGVISADYKPYEGNHYMFCLPTQIDKKPPKKEKKTETEFHNVIPFLSFKKKEDS